MVWESQTTGSTAINGCWDGFNNISTEINSIEFKIVKKNTKKKKKPQTKKQAKPSLSLLFVCYGNVCRSPMAEGLAKKMLGRKGRVKSVGIEAHAGSSSGEAIETMKSHFNIDISRHRSKHISRISVHDFDYIIAMDPYILNRIKAVYRLPPEHLIGWIVEDPMGMEHEYYEAVAYKILKNMRKFFKDKDIVFKPLKIEKKE
jgi:protein-tyrosine-phosphatase